ncbi:hypothetical protein EXIGLDRAFT_702373 [Exidia glandulosa HHB12029]|uniref:Uncharacterized protein n=1 Tax=Exidia glandulosa HHB12029 TaxID=1314781 RepID=A0A165CK07_EXIGL|nr:hypothetical protein EXIGLDRAFT_702373 [Exidia glandulosa HHB12029]
MSQHTWTHAQIAEQQHRAQLAAQYAASQNGAPPHPALQHLPGQHGAGHYPVAYPPGQYQAQQAAAGHAPATGYPHANVMQHGNGYAQHYQGHPPPQAHSQQGHYHQNVPAAGNPGVAPPPTSAPHGRDHANADGCAKCGYDATVKNKNHYRQNIVHCMKRTCDLCPGHVEFECYALYYNHVWRKHGSNADPEVLKHNDLPKCPVCRGRFYPDDWELTKQEHVFSSDKCRWARVRA